MNALVSLILIIAAIILAYKRGKEVGEIKALKWMEDLIDEAIEEAEKQNKE